MTPTQYQQQFNTPLAVVRLASHSPNMKWTEEPMSTRKSKKKTKSTTSNKASTKKRSTTHPSDVDIFDNFFLLAECNHQIWVDLSFKGPFFHELKKYRTVQPSHHKWVCTYGHVHLPVSMLVHCLCSIGCPTVHLRQYGQKLPLVEPFLSAEPAPVHMLSKYNMWDIGVTYKSTDLFLFAPARGQVRGLSTYPLVTPGSLDYGSVQVSTMLGGQRVKVKIYSRLVHLIKSFKSRLQGESMSTLFAVKKKAEDCDRMLQHLITASPEDMGGFRIEVTVMSTTLQSAVDLVASSPLLDMKFWMDPTAPWEHLKLDMKTFSKDALLQNAAWVHKMAERSGLLTGDNNLPATPVHQQVVADLLSSLGWNAGRKDPTPSLSTTAWWNRGHVQWTGPQATTNLDPAVDNSIQAQTLLHLRSSFRGGEQVLKLIDIVRSCPPGYLPCQKEGVDNTSGQHRYWKDTWEPFRLKCSVKSCQHKLYEPAIFTLIAKLVNEGKVPREKVGLPPLGTAVSRLPLDPILPVHTTGVGAGGHVHTRPGGGGHIPQMSQTLKHLVSTFTTTEQLKTLVKKLRKCPPGYIPCQREGVDNTSGQHRYWSDGKKTFRLSCCIKSCQHKLYAQKFLALVASMVDSGQVPREVVDLPTEHRSIPDVHTREGQSGHPSTLPSTSAGAARPVILSTGDSHHGLTCPTNCQPYNTLEGVDFHQLKSLPTAPTVYHALWTPKDGNCMFHAVAKGMGGHLSHKQVRLSTVNFMRQHPQDYVDFFHTPVDTPEDQQQSAQLKSLSKYLSKMSRDSVYGDNIILQGMCHLYKLGLVVLKHTESGAWFWTAVGNMTSARKCFWLYLEGEHYENLLVATQVKF